MCPSISLWGLVCLSYHPSVHPSLREAFFNLIDIKWKRESNDNSCASTQLWQKWPQPPWWQQQPQLPQQQKKETHLCLPELIYLYVSVSHLQKKSSGFYSNTIYIIWMILVRKCLKFHESVGTSVFNVKCKNNAASLSYGSCYTLKFDFPLARSKRQRTCENNEKQLKNLSV